MNKAELEERIACLEDEVAELEKENDDLTAKVGNLEDKNSDLEETIDELTRQLDAVMESRNYLAAWRRDPDPYGLHGIGNRERLEAMGLLPEHMR